MSSLLKLGSLRSRRGVIGCIGGLLTLSACSLDAPTKTFEGAPIPPMLALVCDLSAKHNGVLNPEYESQKAEGTLGLTFSNLDARAGTAQLIGNSGAVTVEFQRLDGQLHFLERTLMGNLTATVVFAPPFEGAPLPAVHSRHIAVAPGNIVISQYAGFCGPRA